MLHFLIGVVVGGLLGVPCGAVLAALASLSGWPAPTSTPEPPPTPVAPHVAEDVPTAGPR